MVEIPTTRGVSPRRGRLSRSCPRLRAISGEELRAEDVPVAYVGLKARAAVSSAPSRGHPHGSSFDGRPVQAIAAARSPREKRLRMPDLCSDSSEKRETGHDDQVDRSRFAQRLRSRVRVGLGKRREEPIPGLQPSEILVEVYQGPGR